MYGMAIACRCSGAHATDRRRRAGHSARDATSQRPGAPGESISPSPTAHLAHASRRCRILCLTRLDKSYPTVCDAIPKGVCAHVYTRAYSDARATVHTRRAGRFDATAPDRSHGCTCSPALPRSLSYTKSWLDVRSKPVHLHTHAHVRACVCKCAQARAHETSLHVSKSSDTNISSLRGP